MDTLPLLENAARCSLSPEDLARRIAWLRSEIRPHRLRERTAGETTVWDLAETPGLAEKLDGWAALESRCCSDLVFARVPGAQAGELRLEIRPKRPASRWPRLARLGGLGALATLGVCCGLPLVATALLNGAAAAGLAQLHPVWAIGLAAISAAAGLVWWLRRRASAKGCGCARALAG